MALRLPQPLRSKLETIIDGGFDILHHAFFSATYDSSTKILFAEAERDLDILQEGKRLAYFEREKDANYMKVRNHYSKKYCPGRAKESWLKPDDRERYLWLRLEIDEALNDAGYFYNDRK